MRHRPFWPLVWSLPVVVSFAGIVFHHWAWVVPGMLFVQVLRWYFNRLAEHFHFGDANPGVAVSVSPMRVAVLTDIPIDYVTDDVGELKSLMSTFSEADWEGLIDGLGELPKPHQAGLFPLQWEQPEGRVEH